MGLEMDSPRIEIRPGRGLVDWADDDRVEPVERKATALVSFPARDELLGISCSLVGDMGDGASG